MKFPSALSLNIKVTRSNHESHPAVYLVDSLYTKVHKCIGVWTGKLYKDESSTLATCDFFHTIWCRSHQTTTFGRMIELRARDHEDLSSERSYHKALGLQKVPPRSCVFAQHSMARSMPRNYFAPKLSIQSTTKVLTAIYTGVCRNQANIVQFRLKPLATDVLFSA